MVSEESISDSQMNSPKRLQGFLKMESKHRMRSCLFVFSLLVFFLASRQAS